MNRKLFSNVLLLSKTKFIITLTIIVAISIKVKSDVKFCFNHDYQVLTTSSRFFSSSSSSASSSLSLSVNSYWGGGGGGLKNPFSFAHHCPFGLLFEESVELATFGRNKPKRICITEDICKSQEAICGKNGKIFEAQYLYGNFTINENFEIFEESDYVPDDIRCFTEVLDNNYLIDDDSEKDSNGKLSRKRRTAPGETEILSTDPVPQDIVDETRLLFYFLAGINTEDVRSKHRVVSLIEPAIDVVKRRCDPTRLDPMFMDTIHEAMLFLIKQEGTSNLEDITADEANKMSEALKRCSRGSDPIKIHGSDCIDTINYVSHRKNGKEGVKNYIFDEKYNFKWGMYDPVVDALWLTVDIIHGLCNYDLAKFDLQHKFLPVMTKIFTMKKIMDRWSRPTPLLRQEAYDHIFLAPMNQSLNILDACNVGAYIHSPYPYRSLREINRRKRRLNRKRQREAEEKMAAANSQGSRVKRSINENVMNSYNNMDSFSPLKSIVDELHQENKQVAYCLQTEEERDERINYMRKHKCK